MPQQKPTANNTANQPKQPIIITRVGSEQMADGSAKKYKVTVYTDERTASMVQGWTNSKGGHFFKPTQSRSAFNFSVAVDSFDRFMQSNALKAMLSLLSSNGYTISPDEFKTQVENGMSKMASTDDIQNLDMSHSKLMDDMLDQFENKLNDPMVVKLLETMKVFDPETGDFKEAYKMFKGKILQLHNIQQVCAQWRNANKVGTPTYVATRHQWARDFNRYVVQNATPLLMTTPTDQKNKSIADSLADNNLTRQQYRTNSHVRHAVKQDYYDTGPVNGYFGAYVYDITDTEVLPGMPDLFNEDEGYASNLWPDMLNQAAINKGRTSETVKTNDDAFKAAGFEENTDAVTKVSDALQVFVNENPKLGANVASALNRKDLVGAVRAYFETESYIDSEHNPNVKDALLNMCVFAALNHYGIAPANMLQNFQQARQYLTQGNKRLSAKMKIKFMPYYQNFVEMVETNAKKAAKNESANIRNSFASMWNRLVEIKERDKNDVIF